MPTSVMPPSAQIDMSCFVLLPHVRWPHVNLVWNQVPVCRSIANRMTVDIFVFVYKTMTCNMIKQLL